MPGNAGISAVTMEILRWLTKTEIAERESQVTEMGARIERMRTPVWNVHGRG